MKEWNIETLLEDIETSSEMNKDYLLDKEDCIILLNYIEKINKDLKTLEDYVKELELEKVNKLLRAQDMLYNEMKRLDDEQYMKTNGKREIMRSGALSQSVSAYIKAINVQIKVKEMCKTNPQGQQTLLEELGVISDD